MSLFHAVILGILEGITEFLPISSTGHLILASHLLKISPSDFLTSFEIAIQLGAILAVLVLYARKFLMNIEVLKRVLTAFLPTAVLGFLLYKLIKKFLLTNVTVVLSSLFIGGVLLILFELWHREKDESTHEITLLSYNQCFLIGIFQSFAVIPGVSRAAATIIGGLLLGVRRRTIVEFSFLLAVPTLLAATGLDLIKSGASFSADQFYLLFIGAFVAFIVAIFSIKLLLRFIQTHSFIFFGVYRIALALFLWFLI